MFANGVGNNNDESVNAFVSQSGYLIATRNERPVLLTHYFGVKRDYHLGEFAALIATLAT